MVDLDGEANIFVLLGAKEGMYILNMFGRAREKIAHSHAIGLLKCVEPTCTLSDALGPAQESYTVEEIINAVFKMANIKEDIVINVDTEPELLCQNEEGFISYTAFDTSGKIYRPIDLSAENSAWHLKMLAVSPNPNVAMQLYGTLNNLCLFANTILTPPSTYEFFYPTPRLQKYKEDLIDLFDSKYRVCTELVEGPISDRRRFEDAAFDVVMTAVASAQLGLFSIETRGYNPVIYTKMAALIASMSCFPERGSETVDILNDMTACSAYIVSGAELKKEHFHRIFVDIASGAKTKKEALVMLLKPPQCPITDLPRQRV
jgi:hypothetical protein